MNYVRAHKPLVFAGIAILALVIIISVIYGNINSARGGAVQRETALVAQYKDNQNELSTYILQFNESLGIADRQSDKLNSIILDAVKGRYDNDTSLQPGTGGAMFSAISEAYPDLTATTASYAKVQDLVISGRDAYKNKQSKLLDEIRDYNSWRNEDILRSFILKNIVGAPTDALTVTDSGQTYTGEAALTKISQIVLTQDAQKAYDTGTQAPLITPEATPSK